MTRDIYTLEIPRENLAAFSDIHPPVVSFVSSLIYALAASASTDTYSLLTASILPLYFIFSGRVKLSAILKINVINAVMILTLALTWPEIRAGFIMGMIIALRVNMIYIVFSAMVYPLGFVGIYEALCSLRVPEKLRVLVILTLRGINILHERYESAIVSVKLRAPDIRGMMRLKVFAYILGNVLLQGMERSDNMMKAVECRGGFGGFMQSENTRLKMDDIAYAVCFAVYGMIIAVMNYV